MECDAKKEEEEKEEEGRGCPSSIIGISYGWSERGGKRSGVEEGRQRKMAQVRWRAKERKITIS